MKSHSLAKQILLVFLVSLVGYACVFNWIEHGRRKNGPWQVTFAALADGPAIVINQPALQYADITIVFGGVAAQPNLPQTVRFEHGRAAPFALPFGKCVFVDAIFLPGTATFDIFGHEIQLLPRTLTIDGGEHPWRSGEKFFLTERSPTIVPAK